MKYPDFIEQVIIEKNYNQLTSEEKALVSEWVANEDEYNAIKAILTGIDIAAATTATPQPSTNLKQSLQHTFAGKHKKTISKRRLTYTITGVAASVALFLSFWILFNDTKPTENVAQNIPATKEEQTTTDTKKMLPQQSPAKMEQNTSETQETIIPEPIKNIEQFTPPVIEDMPASAPPDAPAPVFVQSVSAADNNDLTALSVAIF